jgi:3D (Asp-Asp-Asp) domain-containing protein
VRRLALLACVGLVGAVAAADSDTRELEVTATAYNSVPGQTQGNPRITAWGHRLEPGEKAIAVSRDLLELGLRDGTRVEIDGLPGTWVVRDKMARRWRRHIDIYMGDDVEKARRWGRRRVTIRWQAPASD